MIPPNCGPDPRTSRHPSVTPFPSWSLSGRRLLAGLLLSAAALATAGLHGPIASTGDDLRGWTAALTDALVPPAQAREAEAGLLVRIPLHIEAAELSARLAQGGVEVHLPGYRLDPDDPRPLRLMRDLAVVIPAGTQVRAVRLEGGATVVVDAVMPEDESGAAAVGPDGDGPGAWSRGDGWWHGVHLAFVRVRPLGSRGGQAVLREGCDLVVELERSGATPVVARRLRADAEQRLHVRRLLEAAVANPGELLQFAPELMDPWLARAQAGGGLEPAAGELAGGVDGAEGLLSEKTPSLGSGPYRYLVICPSELAAAFEPLADFRESQGLPSLVVTLDEIRAVYREGLDLAETIRLYLRDAYEKWGVDYVLLGGDTDVLPTRHVISTYYPSGGETEIPTDWYFAGLDGNWNADGDAIFGEAYTSGADPGDYCDFIPELAVGRAPVSTAQEAADFVRKVMAYERAEGRARFNRVLFASEVLFPQDWQPGDTITRDGAIVSEGLWNTITTASGGSFEATRRYQNYTDYPGAVEETKAAVLADLESGAYGLFHHVGHGFYYNMSVGDKNIFVQDADGLTNGSDTFVLMALNCDSAAFDFDCLLERFLRNPDGGSVASIGSARAAFDITTNQYQQALYKVIFEARRQRLGDAIVESRRGFAQNTFYNTIDRWTQLVYALLGDPAMRVWTATPRSVTVDAPSSVTTGSGPVTVGVHDSGGAPLDSVAVVLRAEGLPLVVEWTGADGSAVLDLPTDVARSWTLTVNGRDILPYQGSLAVVAGSAAQLSVAGFSVDDSAGNGNGRIEAGERVALTALVVNGGASGVSGGTLHLECDDPWLSVIDAETGFPPVGGGEQATATGSFTVEVAADVPDAHWATLTVSLDDGNGGVWTDEERLPIENGEVEIVALELDDGAGNGDGVVDPGEAVALRFTLKNYGAASIAGVTGELISLDPAASVSDGAASWGPLDGPLSTAVNDDDPFVVVEDDTTVPRLYRLRWTTSEGTVDSIDFDLRRPAQVSGLSPGQAGAGSIVLSWDASADRDLMGYVVFRREADGGVWERVKNDVLTAGALVVDEGLPGRTLFDYRVEAVDRGGLHGPASEVVQVSTAPPEVGCFPLPMGQETSGALAVGNLDADGVLDMAVPSDFIYAIDGECREKVDGDDNAQTFGPISAVDGGWGPSGLSMGDLDGDGLDEIVAENWSSAQIYVYEGDGTLRTGWPVKMTAQAWTTPVLGDLDGDGRLEIVTNDVNGWTWAFHEDGSEVADGDGDAETVGPIAPQRSGEVYGRTTPALLDVDGDGHPEILFGSKFLGDQHEYFYALKGDGSGNAGGWPKDMGVDAPFLASPAIGDVDGDGEEEIVALCESNWLYVWEKDGSALSPFPVYVLSRSTAFLSQAPSPALCDFEGDGPLEIVAVSIEAANLARVHVFDHLGQERAGWPQTVPGLSESSPVVADLNGDGRLEVVFGIGGGQDNLPSLLYAWEDDGTLLDGFPIRLDGFVRATPTVCDFNGDGNANLVLASWDRLIHVWDLGAPFDAAHAPWPTFHGNSRRDGVYRAAAGKTVTGGEGMPSKVVRLLPNHPNPFNPSTEIVFELPAGFSGKVSLQIHSVAGRRVRTLWTGHLDAGVHRLRWDGRDGAGAPVASGVYFAHLLAEGRRSVSRKLILVR